MTTLDKDFYIAIGKVLKTQRTKLKMSLQNVVDKLPDETKIARQTLNKYELGQRRISTTTFNELCKILELSPNDVLDSIKITFKSK